MASGQFATLLHHLHRLIGPGSPAEQSDGQLLYRFGHDQEQEAFTALVRRHGPMVLGVCRRVLHDAHDAEDVFQATFLVLVRKAKSLHQYGSLGNWLHTVAYHLALKTRGRGVRRRTVEQQGVAVPEPTIDDAGAWRELRPVLDAELDRLPLKYRAPVVLCYLEGKTNEEAARELGWPTGTVKIRLARARDLLRGRLARRGLTVASALLTGQLAEEATAAVSATLLLSTTRAATLFAAGDIIAAGAGAGPAVQIAQGALKTMFLRKLQTAAILLIVLGVVGTGTGALLGLVSTPNVVAAEQAAPAAERVDAPAAADTETKTKPILLGSRSRRVHKQLAQVVKEFAVDANTPLKDALDAISERYKVTILIDNKAFEAIGVQKVEEQPVQLPKMSDMRLTTVLHKLLKQIRGDVYHGTFQVRPGYVEVTTNYNQMCEAAAEAPDHPALRGGTGIPEPVVPRELSGDPSRKGTPVVHVDADHRALAEVLRDLADDAEIDLVIDRRAAEKAQTPINLTLNNVLLDTAVGLLVDAADMDWMWIDNVVFVATKEDIKARKERKKAAEQERVKLIREAKELENAAPGLAPPLGLPAPPSVKPIAPPGGPPPVG